MTTARPDQPAPAGAHVRVECRKWPDSPHWEFDAVRLGADAHGHWLGIRRGTLLSSPKRAFTATADHVTLVPHDAWWLATFYGDDDAPGRADAGRPFATYVDVTTPAVWHDEHLVRAVDLDLDVIEGTTGRVWIDDEDEFAEHRVALAYPDDVVTQAVRSCQAVFDDVRGRVAPYDGSHRAWLDRLRTTT